MISDLVHGVSKFISTVATDLSGGDVAMKGVISLVLLTLLGTLVTFGRKLPGKLYKSLLARVTVSVEICSDWRGENRELFAAAGDFVATHQYKKYLKVIRADVASKELKVDVGISESSGIFFYKGRPVWYSLSNAKEQGAVPETITIRVFGRTAAAVINMISAAPRILKNHTRRNFYVYEKEWRKIASIPEKDRELFLNPDVKKKLDRKLEFFIKRKQWFLDRAINHKLLIILDGPPGTGKSAISRYVADYLGWSLGTISKGIGFENAVREAADSDIVVSVPDVDALSLCAARDGVAKMPATPPKTEEKDTSTETPDAPALSDSPSTPEPESKESEAVKAANAVSRALTMQEEQTAAVLNLFQGDLPLNNSVVIMSTNCIEKLDEALLRPSRCDLRLTIGALGIEEVNGFRSHYYEEATNKLPASFDVISIRACDLMEGFTNNAFDLEGFDRHLTNHI